MQIFYHIIGSIFKARFFPLIRRHLSEQLFGHMNRDSTEIECREKAKKRGGELREQKGRRKRGRPKKGEEVVKELTRLERQREIEC